MASNSTTTRYRIILTGDQPVDLADALTASCEGTLVSSVAHADGLMVLIDVADAAARAFLESLLERTIAYAITKRSVRDPVTQE